MRIFLILTRLLSAYRENGQHTEQDKRTYSPSGGDRGSSLSHYEKCLANFYQFINQCYQPFFHLRGKCDNRYEVGKEIFKPIK